MAANCYLITLAAIVALQGLPVDGLRVRMEGELATEGGLRFTRIMHHPKVDDRAAVTEKERANRLDVASLLEELAEQGFTRLSSGSP